MRDVAAEPGLDVGGGEGRAADIGRRLVPREERSRRNVELAPDLACLGLLVGAVVIGRIGGGGHGRVDLVPGRPEIRKMHRSAVRPVSDRIGQDVAIDVAGERVRHRERGRGQESGLDLRVHAAGEVTVSGENGHPMDAALLDGLPHRRRERTRIADAGRAAVADDAEAERLEILEEPRPPQIALGGGRAGSEGGLHPGLRREAEAPRLAGEQPGGDRHAGIARIRAARDGRDGDGAVGRLGRVRAGGPQRHVP